MATLSTTRQGRAKDLTVRMTVAIAAAIVCVLAFIRLVDFNSVGQRLEHLNFGLAVVCGVVFLSAYVVRALRWRWFLTPHQVSVPRAIAIYQVAIFVNWLLPVRGGEVVKCLLLRRLNAIPISDSAPAVTMDKLMDLLPAVGLVVLVPFLHLELGRSLWLLLVFALVIVCMAVLLIAMAIWRRQLAVDTLVWLTKWLPDRARSHVEPFVVRFVGALISLVMRPRLLLVATAYTVVAILMDALFCFLAFHVVDADVAFLQVLFGYTLYNLAYVLPTPPGQIGSNELIGLLVFSGALSVNRSAVAAMFLFSHPWTALLMVISGIVCLSAMGLTLRLALSMSNETATIG